MKNTVNLLLVGGLAVLSLIFFPGCEENSIIDNDTDTVINSISADKLGDDHALFGGYPSSSSRATRSSGIQTWDGYLVWEGYTIDGTGLINTATNLLTVSGMGSTGEETIVYSVTGTYSDEEFIDGSIAVSIIHENGVDSYADLLEDAAQPVERTVTTATKDESSAVPGYVGVWTGNDAVGESEFEYRITFGEASFIAEFRDTRPGIDDTGVVTGVVSSRSGDQLFVFLDRHPLNEYYRKYIAMEWWLDEDAHLHWAALKDGSTGYAAFDNLPAAQTAMDGFDPLNPDEAHYLELFPVQ